MKNLFNLPNVLTLCNLICGCLGIIVLFQHNCFSERNPNEVAFALMIVAAIFDFFDGFAARLLKITSPIGKQLDSLADVVTFGVLPGMIVYEFLKYKFSSDIALLAILIPLFSALRLAKFNVDERQNLGFIGLPTPANALFFASLMLLDVPHIKEIVLIMIPLFCYFMIAEIPLFALKFKNFSFKGNEIKYIFLLLCLVLILVLQLQAMPFIILSYLLMSVVNNKIAKS
ncbi:MAG: CDP-diacylglycerol--serine O-phosphatidyltransferase [Flavobacteriales bacterium]